MVPITLSNGDVSFETLALLDSGADASAISREMAEVPGLGISVYIEHWVQAGLPLNIDPLHFRC
jgi:hypothetical protein